jgi:hypothetical protein
MGTKWMLKGNLLVHKILMLFLDYAKTIQFHVNDDSEKFQSVSHNVVIFNSTCQNDIHMIFIEIHCIIIVGSIYKGLKQHQCF